MTETSSRRPPLHVWIAWSLVVLDLIAFFAVLADFRWGPAHGEGALGCFAITAILFIPFLAAAFLSTLLWRRSQWRQTQSRLELKAKVRDIRKRGSEG